MHPASPPVTHGVKRRGTHASFDAAVPWHGVRARVQELIDATDRLAMDAYHTRRKARDQQLETSKESVTVALVTTLEALTGTTRPSTPCPRAYAIWLATCVGPLAVAPRSAAANLQTSPRP